MTEIEKLLQQGLTELLTVSGEKLSCSAGEFLCQVDDPGAIGEDLEVSSRDFQFRRLTLMDTPEARGIVYGTVLTGEQFKFIVCERPVLDGVKIVLGCRMEIL